MKDKNLSSDLVQYVSFRLGDEDFAVEVQTVKAINRISSVTPSPNTYDYVEGVSNLRGNVIPILNLRARLNMMRTKSTKETRVIVLERGEKLIGLMVDSVNGIISMVDKDIEYPPQLTASHDEGSVYGFGKFDGSLIIILDARVIFDPEIL